MSNFIFSNISHSRRNDPLENGPEVFSIGLLLIISWMIAINALVFTCLISNHRAMKNYVNVQLLSMSLTDIFVGICAIPITLAYKITGPFANYETCAGIFYMYIASQNASLCHALVICIHRLIVVKRKTKKMPSTIKETFKSVFLHISAVWISCLLFFSIPFLVFARFGETLSVCSLNTIFADNYSIAIGLFAIASAPPHITLNIVYIYMVLYLRKTWKQIGMVKNHHHPRTSSTRPDIMTPIETISSSKNSFKLSVITGNKSDETSTSSNSKYLNVKSMESRPNTTQERTKIFHGQGRKNGNRSKTNTKLDGQKRVLITIGILLITLNIFMTPLTFLTVMESLTSGYLPRKAKYMFVAMATFNSALNPIINISRIKPFREVLRHNVIKIYQTLFTRR